MQSVSFKSYFFIVITFVLSTASAQENPSQSKTIQERLQELEEQQKIIDEWYEKYHKRSQNTLVPNLGEAINFGGYLETAIAHIEGPDTKTQVSPYSNVLGLNLTAHFSERVRLVTQAGTFLSFFSYNPHNNPALPPGSRAYVNEIRSFLTFQSYVEFRRNEILNLQIGLGPVPFGYAFPQREPFLFYTRGGPQMVNINDTPSISTFQWMGIHLNGRLPTEQPTGYNLYTFSPYSSPQKIGLGARLWWEASENLILGLSTQTGEQNSGKYTFFTHGFDIKGKYRRYLLTAEYAFRNNSTGAEDIESYYIEPAIEFHEEKWLVYARADYLSYPGRTIFGVSDPTKKWQHSVGVNWLPQPTIRYRLGFVKHDYVGGTDTISGQRRDFNQIEFSVVTAF